MVARNTPAAEVDVTTDLVHRLLANQHPDLADRSLTLVANGWDNVIHRLGHELAVRVPRREMAARLVEHEQEWLPRLAAELPIPIPAPVRIGRPAPGYPWSWSVTPWFDGAVAADAELTEPRREARRVGEFLRILHRPVIGAPDNPYRGFPVVENTPRIAANLEHVGGSVDVEGVLGRWDELVAAPGWAGEPVMIHGDLHAANIVVNEGRIAAIIDFGDITAGDPAGDFAVAWALFGESDRAELRSAAGDVDDATWSRAEAWALHFGVLFLAHSADSERFERMGRHLLAACGAA